MDGQIEGIVIDFKEYREHDALLQVLDREGNIISMVARGIQKVKSKNASACQLFTFARFQLNVHAHSTLQSLRSAEILDSYRSIREDLMKQSIASFFCECIYKSAFDQNVFVLLKTCLERLQTSDHPILVLCLFQSLMNQYHGIEPMVDSCVRCGNSKHIVGISLNSGGFICEECFNRNEDVKKSVAQLKRFRLLCKAKNEHYDILTTCGCFTFSDFEALYQFFEEYAGIALRSIRFLRHLYAMDEYFIEDNDEIPLTYK
ncbi:MAG: DNA repair protein RecO [Longicatena sp.]